MSSIIAKKVPKDDNFGNLFFVTELSYNKSNGKRILEKDLINIVKDWKG